MPTLSILRIPTFSARMATTLLHISDGSLRSAAAATLRGNDFKTSVDQIPRSELYVYLSRASANSTCLAGPNTEPSYGGCGEPLYDGPAEVTWFCGNCGDGPFPDWQPGCASCGHQKDGCCTEETR